MSRVGRLLKKHKNEKLFANRWGNGCGTFGRAVASGALFTFSHQ